MHWLPELCQVLAIYPYSVRRCWSDIPNTLYLWSILEAARQLSVSDLQSLLGSMTAERTEWMRGEWDAATFAATAKHMPHGSQVSSVADRLSQSYVSNQPWKEPAWHEVMRPVASVGWGNIVVWSLLGSLVTERTEWLRRKLSTTWFPSFSNSRETFQELCVNPPFMDYQRDVKPCKAQLRSHWCEKLFFPCSCESVMLWICTGIRSKDCISTSQPAFWWAFFFLEGKVEQQFLSEMSMWIWIAQTWFQTRHW